jgi:predicted RNA polymerase sigma factor
MSIDTKELLLVAYRTAARILHNRAIAEEASEQAVHRLHLAVLAGKVPERPKAWVRTVARAEKIALLGELPETLGTDLRDVCVHDAEVLSVPGQSGGRHAA